MTNEEKNNILDQHKEVYDGYVTQYAKPNEQPLYVQDLANDIERGFYSRGRQNELVEKIKAIDPNAGIIWGSIERLEKQLDELENALENTKS